MKVDKSFDIHVSVPASSPRSTAGSASGFSPALRVGKGETCNGWTDEDGLHLELGGEGCVTALDLTGGALTQPAFVRLADEVKRHGNYILSRTSDRYMMERLET